MMNLIKTAAAGAIVLGSAYILSTQGRTGHPGLEALRGWHYAHRGLHDDTRPENSMSAFRAALEHGYGIELDIHLLKDGTLAVMHDGSLKRTAGVDVNIADLTAEELAQYQLLGSGEPIPLFREVLDLFAGKAPLIIELKVDGSNHSALVKAAAEIMESYEGPYCMESFDPRCVYALKKNYPQIIRGQLSQNYFEYKNNLHPALKWVMTNQAANFLTMPDFTAYKYQDRKTFSDTLVRKFWGVQGVSWTLKTPEEYKTAVKEGWIPIVENFKP